jgi:3-mercaptopropionate dioxygenase
MSYGYNSDVKTRQYLTSGSQLGELVSAVRTVTRSPGTWEETASAVAGQLRLHLPGPEMLTSEQRYGDPLGYRCHVLHAESDGSFSVVALVWRPGQATPVHDHVSWCVTGIVQGIEHEERFELQDGWLVQSGTSDSLPGEVTGLAPPGDIHRVVNTGPETAISLHVYGTDVGRLSSSIRRIYDQPMVAGESG